MNHQNQPNGIPPESKIPGSGITSFAVDDADAGLFQTDIQSNIKVHDLAPSFGGDLAIIAPLAVIRPPRTFVTTVYVRARFDEPYSIAAVLKSETAKPKPAIADLRNVRK